ncbi:hypothetical protein ACXYMU_13250 [Pontibacter sp. CAU 1760]
MGDIDPTHTPLPDHQVAKPRPAFSAQLSFWVGIIGSLVTIVLTIWNTHTKSLIDKRESELQALEMKLKERTTGVEESKERVDRYKWVLSLFPALNGKDENERNFTLNLARLALTKDEAEQLFAGLQASSDTALRSIGQTGIAAIQNEPITMLVSQMNANTAQVRKSAVATLVRDYGASPQAITNTLRMYDARNINSLSPSAIINGLVYLSTTEPAAWDKQQLQTGRQVAATIEARKPGSQTRAVLMSFNSFLQKVEASL